MALDKSSRESGQVGPYRLLNRLGEGGMGVVHLALDPAGKAVAIKVLRPHVADDPDARARLTREVATLRRVRHPRVATVIDADVEGPVPYVVTTFVPGKTLEAHVRDHGPLPRGHVARIGSVLAEALRSIHDLGVVHRDVKPANVMLLDGDPILIDFGIAHVTDESRLTHTGLVMGTPGYLSPEIIGGDPVTAATDWWGWGATLAYAATGRPPFGTGPIEVVLDRVRRGAADVEGMDPGLRATLTAALTVDPKRRPRPDRLVAGLAAIAPPRTGRTGPPLVIELPDDEKTTERVPPPGEASTVKTPPPSSAAAAASAAAAEAPTRISAPAVAASASLPIPVDPAPVNSRDAVTTKYPSPAGSVPAPASASARSAGAGSSVQNRAARPGDDEPTEIVPPPAAWSAPAVPETRRFDHPDKAPAKPGNGRPQGYSSPNGSPAYGSPNGGPNVRVDQNAPTSAYGSPAYGSPPPAPPAPPAPANGFGAPRSPSAGQAPPQSRPPASPPPWGQQPQRGPEAPAAGKPPRPPGDPSRGVLFGVLLVLAAIAAVAPYGAVWIAGLGMTVARVIDRTNTALLMRRDLHGPRGSDGLVTTMALPWRIVTSAVATVLALILPILIGISVAFIAAWVAAGDPVNQKPGDPGALALGMVALVLTAWWGPGGGSVRRGSGKAVKSLVRGRRAQIVLWAVLGLVVVSALIVMSGPNEPDWGPLNGYRIIDMLTFP